MFIHGSGGTGDKTEEEAKKRAVLLLTNVASAFPASLEEAENAVLSSSGADRYAEDSGKLIIDGTVVAQFSVEKQEDGTYTVSDVTTCAPSVASTEPTPNS
jgi:hypothetical protein